MSFVNCCVASGSSRSGETFLTVTLHGEDCGDAALVMRDRLDREGDSRLGALFRRGRLVRGGEIVLAVRAGTTILTGVLPLVCPDMAHR